LRWFDGRPFTEHTLADLGADDHLIVYPQRSSIIGSFRGLRCKVSILLSEPWGLSKRIYLPVMLLWWKYFRIFTFQAPIIRLLPNARFWIAANSWVGVPSDAEIGGKTRNMSLIASAKMMLRGHRLRHSVARWARAEKLDIDLLGLAYQPFDDKRDGLLPYRFSVVIENSRENGYFTEKLVDALLCGTVPIYWGAPDVEKFFDVRGMLVCRTEDDIRKAIRRADLMLYDSMKAAIARNRETAKRYVDQDRRAADALVIEATGVSPSRDVRSAANDPRH
jgi:hypothetical protein